MAIITLEKFGKTYIVLDDTKISAVTCFDMQERVDHDIPANEHRYIIRVACGGLIDIAFKAAERANWSNCYHTLVAALYREAELPMTAPVPSPYPVQ